MREQILRPTSGTRARFGATLAAHGDDLLVGATARDHSDGQPGAALFTRGGDGFRHLVDLRPALVVDDFARALALDAQRLAVSAAGHENGDQAVHVWQRRGEGVVGPVLIDSPERRKPYDDVFCEYGVALALDGADVLVGANLGDAEAEQSGAVHVMRTTPNIHERQRLAPGPRSSSGTSFGDSLALAGSILAVGAPTASHPVKHAGAVHIFQRSPDGRFSFVSVLSASAAESSDELGGTLAFDGQLLCVGAPRAKASTGRVEIFRRVDAGFGHLCTLHPPVAYEIGLFGHGLAFDGRRLAVGEPGGPGRRGRVHLYSLAGAGFALEETWMPADATDGDWFGSAVALGSGLVHAGAPGFTGSLDQARVISRSC